MTSKYKAADLGGCEADRHLLAIRPIEIEANAPICVQFREDSFLESFGNCDEFWGPDRLGDQRYLTWLAAKAHELSGSCCHAWYSSAIIGQFEFGRSARDPQECHLFLLYVTEQFRNRSIVGELLARAEQNMRGHGFVRARLRVSQSNQAAIRFYARHEWNLVGADPADPRLLIMNKSLLANG